MSRYAKRTLFGAIVGFAVAVAVAIWLPLSLVLPALVVGLGSLATSLILCEVAFRASALIWRDR